MTTPFLLADPEVEVAEVLQFNRATTSTPEPDPLMVSIDLSDFALRLRRDKRGKSMIIRLLAVAGVSTALVALSVPVAMAQSTTEVPAAAAAAALTAAPPAAKIVIDPPLAEPLSRGVVFINYRTEHLMLVPVFGAKAAEVSPPIGHLHVALDGAPWGWGNTSGEPLIIFGLPAGPHTLQITLVNPNHQPLGRSVVEFVIPPREAAPKSH